MKFESSELKRIFDQIRDLNRKNSMLLAKFDGDRKFAILYKNQQPTGKVSDNMPLYNLLSDAKAKIDARLQNLNLLSNPGFFRQAAGEDIVECYKNSEYPINAKIINALVDTTATEYLNEYQGE
jgi:type I restriction enzyme R subunit